MTAGLCRRVLSPILLAGIIFGVTSGCGGPKPQYAKVDGVVTMDGQPLRWVEVIFMPDPEVGTVGPRATAYTDENGQFSLDTRQSAKAGALVGIHRVCIRDLTALNLPPLPDAEPDGKPPTPFKRTRPLVAYVYREPNTTPIRDIEVKLGTQSFTFDVTSEPGTAPKK